MERSLTILLHQIFLRIPDWRQISEPTDYVIVAPKISGLGNNNLGYTCPPDPDNYFHALSSPGESGQDFKILSDGKLLLREIEMAVSTYVLLRVYMCLRLTLNI